MNQFLVMPQATEVEKHVLGAMMMDADAISTATGVLEGADFYDRRYNQIFEAILELSVNRSNVDAITVSECLKRRGAFEMVGNDALMEILGEVHSSASVLDHAKIVKDKSLKRKQIKIANWLHGSAYGDADGWDTQQTLEKSVFELHQTNRARGGLRPIREVLVESFNAIAKMKSGVLTGLKTGLEAIDKHMAGMQDGDMIVLAGRPGQGKTALAAQIGINNAKEGKTVAFFECEMKDRAVVDRALFGEAGISKQQFKHGNISDKDAMALDDAQEVLNDIPFSINDSAGITPMEIRSQCRKIQREKGLHLIIVDNIQRMKSDIGTKDVRVRTGEVSAALKEIAKEFNVPLIAVSHARRLANGEGTEPNLSDLQEAGNIEQDADLVLALFNASLYKEVHHQDEGKVKLIFLKFREGSLGYVEIYFEKELTKFYDWDKKPTKPFDVDRFMGTK